MGQRSQIYIRYYDKYEEKIKLIARYYQWNWSNYMISRARWSLEWIKDNFEYMFKFEDELWRIMDINFDIHSVVPSSDLIKEYREYKKKYDKDILFRNFVFNNVDNNDGKLFIDINKDGKISYCFTTYEDTFIPMEAEQYMIWDTKNCYEEYQWKNIKDKDKTTCRNIKKIEKLATLMTQEQLDDFLNYKYEE
mgnify:CR=1 FL=1